MAEYSIQSIANSLRNSASGVLWGKARSRWQMEDKQAEAKKMAELQAEQANIDEFNARARSMGLTLRPDVIVNGIPVEKSAATPPVETQVTEADTGATSDHYQRVSARENGQPKPTMTKAAVPSLWRSVLLQKGADVG
jgi:hypothetical protein